MKKNILLFTIVATVLASCSSLKSTQTSDDVYYSVEKTYQPKEEDKQDEKKQYNFEDRSVRMRVEDGRRWSSLENPYYYETYRYDYNCNCNCNHYGSYNNNNWNNNKFYGSNFGYNNWGYSSYYQPRYLASYQVTKPKYIAPRGGVIGGANGRTAYSNKNYDNTNSSNTKAGGGLINRVFNNNSSSSSSESPRTYNPSSSSSSGSSSSGSSSGSSGASRPTRSGG